MIIANASARQSASVATNVMSPSFIINGSDAAAGITISDGGYKATRDASGNAYSNVRGTVSLSSGIVMASFWPSMSENWSTTESFFGFATASQSLTLTIGGAANESIGVSPSGVTQISNGNAGTVYPWAPGCQIDCAFHFSGKTFFSRVNGGWWNKSSTADPATNTGGISAAALNSFTLYPVIGFYSPSTICWSKLPTYAAPSTPSGITYPWS